MRFTVSPKRRALLLAVLAALSVLCSLALVFFYPNAAESVSAIRKEHARQQLIIHAGGYLTTGSGELVTYTNSREALEQLWAAGRTICELDIREAADGVLVCAHEEEQSFSIGMDLPSDADSEAFLSAKIYGQFTPMSMDDAASFMRSHTGLFVVTDVKDDNLAVCARLAADYPDLRDRFLIQIYHESEYDSVRALGFRHILYTLYQTKEEERSPLRLICFGRTHELVGFTVPTQLDRRRNRLSFALSGTPYILHTVNETDQIDRYLARPFCLAVYSDRIDYPPLPAAG